MLCLAVAFIILISAGSAIVEHVKAETVERMKMLPVLQSTGNEGMPTSGMESDYDQQMPAGQLMPTMQEMETDYEGMPTSEIESGYQPRMTVPQLLPTMQGLKPSIPYTIMAIGNREYIVAGWPDENTQIILLYHDMDELTVQMRTNQWFTRIGETATRTAPIQ